MKFSELPNKCAFIISHSGSLYVKDGEFITEPIHGSFVTIEDNEEVSVVPTSWNSISFDDFFNYLNVVSGERPEGLPFAKYAKEVFAEMFPVLYLNHTCARYYFSIEYDSREAISFFAYILNNYVDAPK